MAPSLINLLGFTTGAVLYAMLFWMVLRSSSDRLSLLTGILGLFWNIGAFCGYGLYTLGLIGPSPFLLAISFSALGFLPSVVVHSVLRSGTPKRSALIVAYALSFTAAVLNISAAAVGGLVPSQTALLILTIGFGLLMLFFLYWGQSLWVVSLAVFAVSALHLSDHQGTDPWWLELIGHHSSLPLALAFLHRNYRFALADIFLKRAMAFVLLVTVVFGLYVSGVAPAADQRTVLLLLAAWVATALIYPWIRSVSSWFVDNIVLKRPDYDLLLAEASRTLASLETEEAILDELGQCLRPALSARLVQRTTIHELPENVVSVAAGRSATAVIPTVESPHYSILIGELEGGRKLLSDDINVIERLAVVAARRIDAVRTAQERLERNSREGEIRRLATEAELRALRAQIHPHFLFNALTTIGYLIQTSPSRALATLMRLSSLLRNVLRSAPEYTTLGEELQIVSAYLDIESARFEDRLSVTIEVAEELKALKVPTLMLQPLVENAIKHGISRSVAGGAIRISGRTSDGALILVVEDTGAGADESAFARGRLQGVGLNSIERRLQCYEKNAASMRISSRPGQGTRVEIQLPAQAEVAEALLEKMR